MIDLAAYMLEPLHQEGACILYRGQPQTHTAPRLPALLVVAPVGDHPALASLRRLEHEYALRAELDPAWAVRPLALVEHQGRPVLVLEDPGGAPLARLLGAPLEVGRGLRLALAIAHALGRVHAGGLIHKDLKPGHILVAPASGAVRLTGFGLASRLRREPAAPDPPEVLAGTLAYMAPEQTGRMNRSVDARSDLYALGVTLYEMLTGSLPFTASEPLEWVHCHIARQPVPPSERVPEVPSVVSAIVMKLLAKTAEDRYQTAAGVVVDLQHCLAEWEATGTIAPFAPSAHDIPDALRIPEKLYGREAEVGRLLEAFDRVVAQGTPELVLVSGSSGVGKSSVVNELHKVLVPARGLFAAGKFDQYKRDIPYSTLAQAFRSLIRPLLAKSESELAVWRDALREALDPNGRLMLDLVPELKLIIGEQPAVPELPPQDAQRRFQLVLRRLIGVFARPDHPLVLFLDDVQWLDTATLDLIEHLLRQPDVRHLMLIGAYRDNEVAAAHPLRRALEALRQGGTVVQEIRLGPLARDDLDRLIVDALRCAPERAIPLAHLVYEKTGGNPFFLRQFLDVLADEGLLAFDYEKARWSWDLERIQAQRYAENVVDLMVGKLHRLPRATQTALQQLACLGNRAEITTLAIVLGPSEEQVQAALWEAVRLELVERLAGSYKFIHDRVQEAAYVLIPEASRAEAHLRIGRLLLARTAPDKREEAIFEIVNQLNRGAALITSTDEREQLAELNLIAGQRAKASTAYAVALTYLTAGAALLVEACWERRHALIFALALHRAECEVLTGALAAAEHRLTMLSTRAATTIERATVACLRMDVYTYLAQSGRAVAVGLDYLRHLGIDWSPHSTDEDVRRAYERIWAQLGSRAIEDLLELPLMTDPASLATLDVLIKLGQSTRFTDANLFALTICTAVHLSLERGNSDGSCYAYVRLGTVAGVHFGDYQAGYRFGQLGYDLVEKHGLKRFQVRTYAIFGNAVMPWTRHVKAGRDLVRRAFEMANQIGDLGLMMYSWFSLISNLLAAGDPLVEVQRETEHGLALAQKGGVDLASDLIAMQLGLVRTLRGLTPTFGSLDDEQFDELRMERRFASQPDLAYAESWYCIRKLQARFFAGDYAAALEASLRAQPLLWTSPETLEAEHRQVPDAPLASAEYYFYGALARAAFSDAVLPDQRRQHVEALAAHHRQLAIWAEHGPENFEHRAALVGAEIARLDGRDREAMDLYEQAIRSARANGFVHHEALANELAARFYATRGFEQIAQLYLRNARHCYLRWGADGKVRQLDALYPHLREAVPVPGATSTIGVPVEHLDLATVLKVSQAVSGEIILEKLLDALMRMAIEHAGAERGLLILLRGEALRIEAEATTSGDTIVVHLRDEPIDGGVLPESIISYVVRTQESVILDDASAQHPFAADAYVHARHAHSVLCLPLLKQAELIGVLYLENNLAPHVFTPSRLTVLKLLASQATIALENACLDAEHQRDAAALREQANLLSLTHDAMFVYAMNGVITYWNRGAEALYGWTPAQAVGQVAHDLLQTVFPLPLEQIEAAVLSADRWAGELVHTKQDGTRVVVASRWAVQRDEWGAPVAILETNTDISERQRAEQRLLAQHSVTRILAEVATVEEATPQILQAMCECLGWDLGTLWRLDREAGVLRCAQMWRKQSVEATQFEAATRASTFRPGSGLPGRVWASRAPACIPDVVHDPTFLRAGIAAREGLHAAFAFPILLGSEILGVIDFVSREIRQPNQDLLDMMASVGSQIGQFVERKRAEEALRQTQAELAHVARLTTLGELTASIAHEINQPLGAMVNSANACVRWLAAQNLERARQSAVRIVADGQRAGAIITRIRALAKNAPARTNWLDLNDTIRDVLALAHSEVRRHRVMLQTHLAEPVPLVLADRIQLQQVLLNLIINAIEAMSGGDDGPRELAVQSDPEAAAGVRVTVRDSGPGLDPQRLDQLFDAFYTTKPQGLGLGLAISRRIIETHGGQLWATANTPRGAVFQFTVPRGSEEGA